jgi:LPS export ABC transporter permease LptG
MRIFDSYIVRSFLVPFLYCFLGFLAVWLVFDLYDNGPDFIDGRVPPIKVLYFYLTQLPDFIMIALPAGLLLALLYCLGRMSRANEIISMLTAGVGLIRILVPLIVVGWALSVVALFINFELAPRARALKEPLLERLTKGADDASLLRAHLYVNRHENRTWYIGLADIEEGVMRDAQIIQQDPRGRVLFKYYVREASYRVEDGTWDFDKGAIVKYDPQGNVLSSEYLRGDTVITGWSETPWKIASSLMEAELLTVPELHSYLRYNADAPDEDLAPFRTHLHYRWALPWTSLIVVFIGAALGFFSGRKGALASVAVSIFLFAAMLILTSLFLALGEGGRVHPVVAAWTPNLLFGAIGGLLLWHRATNRELPRLNVMKLRDLFIES